MAALEIFRLFVALEIPEELKRNMEAAQAELRRVVPDRGARWTRREQFHLTLRFLGDVAVGRTSALEASLRNACGNFAPLRLSVEGVGFFPDSRHPRVVWAGVRDRKDELARLQRAVESATDGFTREETEKRFTGHVTLARIKLIQRPAAQALARAAEGMVQRGFGEWTARRIELMRSELSPEGARHSRLAALPLGAATF